MSETTDQFNKELADVGKVTKSILETTGNDVNKLLADLQTGAFQLKTQGQEAVQTGMAAIMEQFEELKTELIKNGLDEELKLTNEVQTMVQNILDGK